MTVTKGHGLDVIIQSEILIVLVLELVRIVLAQHHRLPMATTIHPQTQPADHDSKPTKFLIYTLRSKDPWDNLLVVESPNNSLDRCGESIAGIPS